MKERFFGMLGDKVVKAYTMEKDGITAEIITYGGAVRSLIVPDKNGMKTDVVLGYADLDSYVKNSGCLGALIGRVGNRIEKGTFKINGKVYHVGINNNGNSLHGGIIGFNKKVWDSETVGEKLILSVFSPDGEEGYPGNLEVIVTYSIENNGLKIEYEAKSDKDTLVNLTNHSYFNLSGEGSGSCLNTVLSINADKITPVDEFMIPHNEFMDVSNTPFDFRTAKEIGKDIDKDHPIIKNCCGYDTNYVLNGKGYRKFATAYSPVTGIKMEAFTDQKGVQLYTANFLECVKGKGGIYNKRDGFCLETQNFPNAINCPDYPDSVLKKDKLYKTTTEFRFSIENSIEK